MIEPPMFIHLIVPSISTSILSGATMVGRREAPGRSYQRRCSCKAVWQLGSDEGVEIMGSSPGGDITSSYQHGYHYHGNDSGSKWFVRYYLMIN